MNKEEISQIFEELAMLAELNDESPFKSRAYMNAARIILDLTDDLETLVNENSLTDIEGIGQNIAAKIVELVNTGKLKSYDKLRALVPDGVFQMLKISGLGPKKVKVLWKKYAITNLGDLKMSCERHALKALPGFGIKTEENILAGIESLKKFSGKWLYIEAQRWAEEVLSDVAKIKGVVRVEIAGSIRRKKEVVKDIDIVAAADNSAHIMKAFVSLPYVDRIVQHGKTKSEVILNSGIQCDLRVVSNDEYPFALHHFTGSKEHNVRMRGLAKSKGIKMNEYGLFEGKSKRGIPCKDEADIFKAFGLDYIEPELREDMGEVDAAGEGVLPQLIEGSDLKGILHVHTNYTDGEATIEEMALAAKSRGYEYIAICDHSQNLTVVGGLKPADVRKQHKEIDALNKRIKNFTILKGIEVDILADGSLDYSDKVLSSFDIVIAAVHTRFKMSEEDMTRRIIRAVENPHVDILAHPTGRLLLTREPYLVDMKRVIDAIGNHKKAVEINAHPQRLDLDWRWMRYAKGRGAKFAICPDAHSTDGIDNVINGVNVARKGWLEKGDVLNCSDLKKCPTLFDRLHR
ncbi:MAG: DNA polymerase/3'-5' exonuclease PolX [Deltaproteobacteria bacterium]|jgi:DNA polymerase (family X)|nr:DNA polymerase/3'-5' exonuclease PolX [Deltaproteobacteria bacterium]